jgi:galactokinase/mevalonate kinase-like predicted kinase
MPPERIVCATAPARLDFAGGWSDTPPICFDRGGAVVNAAAALAGQHPFETTARRINEPVIILASRDGGGPVVLEREEQIRDHAAPGRWDALARACLWLTFGAADATIDLRSWLRSSGGIELTMSSALPRGSGLGGSSILAATILACLAQFTGQTATPVDLVTRTLRVEQLLTTGGGWQDQVGGIYPGVKLTRTEPGPAQTPNVLPLPFDRSFTDHLLLYSTGITRLAKSILEQVVRRYRSREPVVLAIIDELKNGAIEVSDAIKARDLAGFGRGVRNYWELKKRIDSGATTPEVESIVANVDGECLGYTLLGAGGGGFLLMVARDDEAARRIREKLDNRPAATGARFYDFAIDDRGLEVGSS